MAEHEAGHVVVALSLGIELEKVTIDLDEQTVCGEAFRNAIRDPAVTRKNITRAVLFNLGGVVYEQILAGLYSQDSTPMRLPREVGTGDVAEAYRLVDMLDGGPETIGRFMSKTIEILRRNLKPAVAIAVELRRVRTMTGTTAKELWAAHGGRVEPDFAM